MASRPHPCVRCGKVSYPKRLAEYRAKLARRRTNDVIVAYACRYGHGWHVGHSCGRSLVRRSA
jgi:hypothetical protein